MVKINDENAVTTSMKVVLVYFFVNFRQVFRLFFDREDYFDVQLLHSVDGMMTVTEMLSSNIHSSPTVTKGLKLWRFMSD